LCFNKIDVGPTLIMVRGERSCFQLTQLIHGLDFSSKAQKTGGFSSPGVGEILRKEIQTFFWREQVDRKIAGNRVTAAAVAPPANKRRRIKGSSSVPVIPSVEAKRGEVGMQLEDDEMSEIT
jgi:hypothetical protein